MSRSVIKKILVALDFDYTLINANSDTHMYQLAPNKEIPAKLKELYQKNGWTEYMGEIFKLLHKNGVTGSQILNCLESISLTAGMDELFSKLPKDHTEFIIISDSNSVFINHILEKKGINKHVSAVFTNKANFNKNGCLEIEMYHKQDWCSLCAKNLCKGDILSNYVKQNTLAGTQYGKIAFIGDGYNDFCPSLRLLPCDLVFPRVGYNLIETIPEMEQKGFKLKAKVAPWKSGADIVKVLFPWYQKIKLLSTPEPRLADPGTKKEN